ncbi:MAG TPA: hypothetical protein VNS32_11685 [Flavisolibacter sp.]|nr:hypothetical protein [Flavisolibacter sp.]
MLLLFPKAFPQSSRLAYQKRVALYNSAAFDDPETGITKLVKAYRDLNSVDCFSDVETCNKGYERGKKILLDPVLAEISNKIKEFERKNNLLMLDGADMEEKGYMLAFDARTDVTKQFIRFWNDGTIASSILELNLPTSKIGLINSKTLFIKSSALKINGQAKEANIKQYCTDRKLCDNLFKAFLSFGYEKGFTLIFDSSKPLPKELAELPAEDVTEDFISTFNTLNQH